MKRNNKEFVTLVTFSILLLLVTMSAAQAITYKNNLEIFTKTPAPLPLLEDFFFVWEDEFNSYEHIDPDLSYNHVVSGGVAKMAHTYSFWTDPNWDYMKPITINNGGATLSYYAVHVIVEKETEMQNDYDDLRFKHQSNLNIWLNYWIEESSSTEVSVYVLIPSIPSGTSMMYMFYGNENAPGMSNYYTVFEWVEDEANDIQISYNQPPHGAEDPDISYGSYSNGRFLHTWEEGQKPMIPFVYFWKRDIKGKIFNTDGSTAVNTFTIRTGQGTQWRHENPQAAYGGGKWLVTWQHYYTSSEEQSSNIRANFVTPTGGVGTEWVVCDQPNSQANPEVAFDSVNNRFFIVWEDGRQGVTNYNIYGKLYDLNGNQIGNEKIICTDSGNQCEPWVAFNPNYGDPQYMIAWEKGVAADVGPFSIYVGLYDQNLNCIGPGPSNQPLEIATGTTDVDHNFPAVCFNEETEQYLVTWNDGDISDGDWNGNIWGRIFSSSGTTVKPNWQIETGNFQRTDTVNYLGSCWLVSFNGGLKIWGKLVDEDGNVFTDDIQLSASPGAEADWASMAAAGERIFVSWEDARNVWSPPWNQYDIPCIYGNFWQLNTPSGTAVTVTVGSEVGMVLDARVTSVIIEPYNLESWMDFWESHTLNGGDIEFDVLDENGAVIINDINNGGSLSSLNPTYTAIRLRADFTRSVPSQSPELKNYSVRYLGADEEPPITYVGNITGEPGTPPWFKSYSVIVELIALDMPPEYHSGVNHTFFKLDEGSEQIYNKDTGIVLDVPEPELWHIWDIEFWSVDKAGNEETPHNSISVRTDFQDPDVTIIEPSPGEHVRVPFWVNATATDNYAIDRVTFDLAPFGEREGYPKVDTEPPYSFLCEEEDAMGQSVAHILLVAYDKAGRMDYHEIEIYVENWEITIENTNCFIIAKGSGTVSNTFPIVLFKNINWHYTGGYCGTLGQQGAKALDGEHWGIANKFIGISTSSVIIGHATYVKASNIEFGGTVNEELYANNQQVILGNVNVKINNIQVGQSQMNLYYGNQGMGTGVGDETIATYENIQQALNNNDNQINPMAVLFEPVNDRYNVVWREGGQTESSTTWTGLFDNNLNLVDTPSQLADGDTNSEESLSNIWCTILDESKIDDVQTTVTIWDPNKVNIDPLLVTQLKQLFGPENIKVYWDEYLGREVIQITVVYTPPVKYTPKIQRLLPSSLLRFLSVKNSS